MCGNLPLLLLLPASPPEGHSPGPTLLRGASMVLAGVMRASGTVWASTGLGIRCTKLPFAHLPDAQKGMAGIWWAGAITFI